MAQAAGGEQLTILLDRMLARLGQPTIMTSTPALAAALRRSHRWTEMPAPMRRLLQDNPLVQMYQVTPGQGADTVEAEAQAATHVLLAVAERLRRLNSAYGAWRHFDPGAYFDLTEPQTARLVRVAERVTSVHVTFFADMLLPAFQDAEAYWQEEYWPQYRRLRAHLTNGAAPLDPVMTFADHVQPEMAARWTRLLLVSARTRRLLRDELSFWAANGGADERAAWQRAWERAPAPGVAPQLLPELRAVPTLTLAVDFPLPAARQPGRLRRLRQNRERRQRQRARGRDA